MKFNVETKVIWHEVVPDIDTMGGKTYNVDYTRVYSYERRKVSPSSEIDIQGAHLNLTAFADLLGGAKNESASSTDAEMSMDEEAEETAMAARSRAVIHVETYLYTLTTCN